MGHAFCKENIEDRVKLLESIVLNCCVKVTRADCIKLIRSKNEGMMFQRT